MEVETGNVQHSRNEHGHGAQISLYVLHFGFATLAHTCTRTHMHVVIQDDTHDNVCNVLLLFSASKIASAACVPMLL